MRACNDGRIEEEDNGIDDVIDADEGEEASEDDTRGGWGGG